MAYSFFIAGTQLPVPPSKLTHQINNRNETIDLIDGTQMSILKDAGLREYQLEILLPYSKYPFAVYPTDTPIDSRYMRWSNIIPPINYLNLFAYLKSSKTPFQFDVYRELANGTDTWFTEQTVSLEDYTVIEDAENGFDVVVQLNLKEYQFHQTQQLQLSDDGVTYTVIREQSHQVNRAIQAKSGDTLWTIAMQNFGNCDMATIEYLYTINKSTIDYYNRTGGNKYTIYPSETIKLYDPSIGTLSDFLKGKV